MVKGAARVLRPDRRQLGWDVVDLEGLLAEDHRARLVWSLSAGLELTPFYDLIKAREGEAGGRRPIPAVLLSLWLYATLEGGRLGARARPAVRARHRLSLARGGVPVNYHGLADFRVEHGDLLDRLLSESVAALLVEGLIDLDEVIIDGTKIEASAGKGSYRRRRMDWRGSARWWRSGWRG